MSRPIKPSHGRSLNTGTLLVCTASRDATSAASYCAPLDTAAARGPHVLQPGRTQNGQRVPSPTPHCSRCSPDNARRSRLIVVPRPIRGSRAQSAPSNCSRRKWLSARWIRVRLSVMLNRDRRLAPAAFLPFATMTGMMGMSDRPEFNSAALIPFASRPSITSPHLLPFGDDSRECSVAPSISVDNVQNDVG